MIGKSSKWHRPVVYSLLIVILIFAGSVTWVALGYKKFIKKNISAWVSKATDSMYQASIVDISINVFTRKIIITGIKVWPDTNIINNFKETGRTHNISVTVVIPKLQLNSIKWQKFVSSKELVCGETLIWQPEVLIVSKQRKPDSSQIQPEKKKSPAIKKIFAQTIDIMQPDIVFRSFDLKNDSFDCKLIGGKAVLNDWLFGEGKSDTSRFLFAKSCIIDSSAFSFCKPVTLYEFKTPVFYFNTDKKQLSIKDLVIAPIVNRETYYQITGNRGTICNIIIQQTDITDFDSKRLIHTGEFYASALTITNPAIGLYYNYLIQYHPENMIHIDPHQLLNNLPVKINIGAISVNNASVIYTELSEKSRQEGVLSFDKINSHANRLTNMDNVISKNGSFIVKGSGVLFHKSKITASFSLALYDTLGAFTVDARAENINAPEIRKAASALTLLKVDSLQLSRMYGHIKGNQNYTQSELTILYTNLKIELQKTDRNANLKTKPGISLIANTFFVYTDNPMPGGQVRSASTYMPRDPTIPFFPTIVKNIKKGTKKILTKHEKIVAALTNPDAGGKQEKQEKQVKQEKQKKKGFFKRLFGKKENKAQ